jgi:CubicO group peptidase (beta-lactamase class C family)
MSRIVCLFACFVASVCAGTETEAFKDAAQISREAQGIAMLVLLDGKVVHEEYPNGGGPERATELASGTKSFSGVLALCAVEDELLDLDEKASNTLTEWRDDPARRDITIRQILTLTSGIPGGASALRGGRVPSYAEAIKVSAVAAPGAAFSYGPNPFQVFGEILRRKLAGRPKPETVAAYMKRRILEPLGIKPARWRTPETGEPHLPSGAALTARDWSKFGEAIRLDAKGILPAGMIAEAFRGTHANPGYGLTWWLPGQGAFGAVVKRNVGTGMPRDIWMAAGAGGQRLVIVPSLKLVAVRLAPLRSEEQGPFSDVRWLRQLVEGARTYLRASTQETSPR